MTQQRATSVLALIAFLLGGVVSAVHGPAGACSDGVCCDDSPCSPSAATAARETVHVCSHEHVTIVKDDQQAKPPQPVPSGDECPVCEHLTMSVVHVAVVTLPILAESAGTSLPADAIASDLGPIGVSLSRGPPAA